MITLMEKKTVKQLLFEHHNELEKQRGKRFSVSELAEFVGIKPKTFEHLYSGRRLPTREQAKLLEAVFKDKRFYEAAGIVRDDPNIQYVQRNWGYAPHEVQRKLAEELSTYSAEPLPKNNGE